MKASRIVALIVLLLVIAFVVWYFLVLSVPRTALLTIYYAKLDGTSLGTWTISQRARARGESSAAYERYEAMYAAVQNVAGPPSETQAIRFPTGTRVEGVTLDGPIANVDLSDDVTHQAGSFGEGGEFKALVYTLTALPGIDGVQVTVAGKRLETLPHGNLELDAPLHRTDW